MFSGGDGYAVLVAGTAVAEPGDHLLDVVVDFVALASVPPSPGAASVVEGRIIGP
jgi:hypothetical protein